MKLLQSSKRQNDLFWQSAKRFLIGKEIKGLCIGYSNSGTSGSGIGEGIRNEMLSTAKQIVDAGVLDPEIFELVGMLQEGMGADRISDMICRIVAPDIYSYSDRIFSSLNAKTVEVTFGGKSYYLPINPYNKESIKLLPTSILSDLPLAFCWSDIDVVCGFNAALRQSVNEVIGNTWKEAVKLKKHELRDFLVKNPELIKDALDLYRTKKAAPYDFEKDPSGQVKWKSASEEATSKHPLPLSLSKNPTLEEIYDVVDKIVLKFKDLVENNALSSLFYKDNNAPKHEEAAQKLFYGIADCYCEANNVDLTREANAGRGPVDFKFSKSYGSRVLVEIKLSANPRMIHGYQKQLDEYRKAEKSLKVIFLVVDVVGGNQNNITKLKDLIKSPPKIGELRPTVYFIDAIPRPPASKI